MGDEVSARLGDWSAVTNNVMAASGALSSSLQQLHFCPWSINCKAASMTPLCKSLWFNFVCVVTGDWWVVWLQRVPTLVSLWHGAHSVPTQIRDWVEVWHPTCTLMSIE